MEQRLFGARWLARRARFGHESAAGICGHCRVGQTLVHAGFRRRTSTKLGRACDATALGRLAHCSFFKRQCGQHGRHDGLCRLGRSRREQTHRLAHFFCPSHSSLFHRCFVAAAHRFGLAKHRIANRLAAVHRRHHRIHWCAFIAVAHLPQPAQTFGAKPQGICPHRAF